MFLFIVSVLSSLVSALSAAPMEGTAVYSVSMPQMNDEVVYNLNFMQLEPTSARWMECDYLVEWQAAKGNGRVGFSAFAGGNHFRYGGGDKLQEYHAEADSVPFLAGKGVQRTAQFVDILPAVMASELKAMAENEAYTICVHSDTLIGGEKCVAVDAVMRVDGTVWRKSEYVFKQGSYLPVRVVRENNVGQVSEQTVTVEYSNIQTGAENEINEDYLMERYKEIFTNFRRANFRIDKLKGLKLPAMTLPTTTGERYSRGREDKFRAPTVVVMMESGAGFNAELVKKVRDAVDSLPLQADVLWVFADSHVDSIEAVTGELREGEHALMSARGFMRDCGATNLPTVIICDSEARVTDVKIGYNNDADLFVIQNIAILK